MMIKEQVIRKVLMTADPVGGVWTYAMDLCRALNAADISVDLATMGCCLSESQHEEVKSLSHVQLHESNYKLEWMENPWDDVEASGEWLLELERETKPDIIHLNGYMHAVLKWQAPVLVVAHSCVLSWWQGVLNEPAPKEWDEYKRRVAAGLRAADAVVSISNTYAGEINRLYGPLENVTVIYNGRDIATFYSEKKQQQLFAMGRIWDEAKNLSILSKITNPEKLPILIAGDNTDPNTGEVVQIEHVQLLGKLPQDEIRKYLAVSSYYVLPAKYEPFGLSALEAALSGCLLFLAENPTLQELWGDAAFYFHPDKPDELDALLLKVHQQPALAAEMVQRSSTKAREFSLDKMADKYLQLYQHLVQTNVVS